MVNVVIVLSNNSLLDVPGNFKIMIDGDTIVKASDISISDTINGLSIAYINKYTSE